MLKYKAHCTSVDIINNACATDREMENFISSLDVHLAVETHNNEKNLILYFTPFPVKYLNYLKRWNNYGNEDGVVSRYKGKQNKTVYVQLFRINKKGSSQRNSWGRNYITSPYNGNSSSTQHKEYVYNHLCYNKGKRVVPIMSYNGDHNTKWKHKKIHFRYPLSLVDAARGYSIMLKNIHLEDSSCPNTILSYGGAYRGMYDFRGGIIGGVAYNNIRKYCPRNETKKKKYNKDELL